MQINVLRDLCASNKIKWTLHALKRIRERNIQATDVVNTILHGEAITHYHDDKPFPSYLIFNSDNISPLHVVASAGSDAAHIITTYIPTLDEWEDDYKTRRS